ncbi:uncharacterized protein PAC_06460 [Phialocephala subalpina]|uniref:DUF7923 domain-containing protein n=1 Tax=Phialocephala subalpina TaxID=576137 RepID=A0A1L7WUX2_9HELO|nr:uncharacterized protein PAC_06460 [Phialocephala subalpina]
MEVVKDGDDYRSRLEDFETIETQRRVFIEEILNKLDDVTSRLQCVTKERENEVSMLSADLEAEREFRRGFQSKAEILGQRLSHVEQARFVLVLIDADADIYMASGDPLRRFRNEFLVRGAAGGETAAAQFVAKVREYLESLGTVKDPNKVHVVVKAYANQRGLAQACARDKKVSSAMVVVDFWCGFTRRFPLADFVDVGPGKEEADNKLREVLAHHITNPLCEHVLLACCHDAGYVPVLRQYAEQQSSSRKITLIASGDVRPNIGGLSFQMTNCFEALFAGGDLVQSAKSYADVSAISPPNTFAKKTITLTNGPNAPGAPVQNCHRLRPILYNAAGKRVDKFLSVNEDLINELKKQNLCSWHYLRADCIQSGCKRNHERKRPLSPKHYDAIWYIARMGTCYTVKKGRNCEDDQCFYGHGFG